MDKAERKLKRQKKLAKDRQKKYQYLESKMKPKGSHKRGKSS